jgi:hypothetical protein
MSNTALNKQRIDGISPSGERNSSEKNKSMTGAILKLYKHFSLYIGQMMKPTASERER